MSNPIDKMDTLGLMMAWEDSGLDDDQTITLFQHLIDNGWAWTLQDCYGRMAAHLISLGYCHR